MTEIFPQLEPLNYKISQQSDFWTRPVGSAYDNIESIGYLWSNTRKLVPSHLKKQYLFKGFNIWHKKSVCQKSALAESGRHTSTKWDAFKIKINFILLFHF